MNNLQQQIDSGVVSYAAAGAGIGLSLADIATAAQQWALILGCVILAIRVVYDGIALYRRIKGQK